MKMFPVNNLTVRCHFLVSLSQCASLSAVCEDECCILSYHIRNLCFPRPAGWGGIREDQVWFKAFGKQREALNKLAAQLLLSLKRRYTERRRNG